MVEFNPDGSIKLPERFAESNEKLKSQRCIKIKRELVNFSAPKRCILHLTLSDVISDNRFVETLYNEFKSRASVPSSIKKINEKQFDVQIETDFRRCSDCNSFINEYREFLGGVLIDDKGGCTFEGRKKNFCYEDYFE